VRGVCSSPRFGEHLCVPFAPRSNGLATVELGLNGDPLVPAEVLELPRPDAAVEQQRRRPASSDL
jgi:hypothetical protein